MDDKLYFTLEYDPVTYGTANEENYADAVISFVDNYEENWKVANFLYDYIREDLGLRKYTNNMWMDAGMIVIHLYSEESYDFFDIVSSFRAGIRAVKQELNIYVSFDIFDDGAE